MNKFSLIAAHNKRSFVYLDELIKLKICPQEIIFLNKKNFEYLKIAKRNNIQIKFMNTNDINSREVVKYLMNNKIKHFIYSGYASKIIRSIPLLKSKHLIHAHSGKIPEFKGSTTIFYTILQNKPIYCSVFRMNRFIDGGKLITAQKFKMTNNDLKNFDNFDNRIRIYSIIRALKKNFKTIKKKINNKNILDYHVAHPIIRALAKQKLKKNNKAH